MLAAREIDYHIVYMMEKDFEKRVEEIYIAKQTHQRAPLFIDILEELVDLEAALFLIHHKEAFAEFSEPEYDALLARVEGGDTEAIQLVCERMNRNFIEKFAQDLYTHLMLNQLSFLEIDIYDKNERYTHNSPIQNVW